MTKESRTWHGRMEFLDHQPGSVRDTGLGSSKGGGPWGNKGQTILFQGRDISSGSQQEGSAHSPVGGSGEAEP